jgi:hypothetical protein
MSKRKHTEESIIHTKSQQRTFNSDILKLKLNDHLEIYAQKKKPQSGPAKKSQVFSISFPYINNLLNFENEKEIVLKVGYQFYSEFVLNNSLPALMVIIASNGVDLERAIEFASDIHYKQFCFLPSISIKHFNECQNQYLSFIYSYWCLRKFVPKDISNYILSLIFSNFKQEYSYFKKYYKNYIFKSKN